MDELIPTPNGFVRNGDLQTGDPIFGEDGNVYEILAAHSPRIDESYRVEFDDGTFTYVHGGHLWHTFTFHERQAMSRRRQEVRARRRANRPSRGTGKSPWLAERNRIKARGYLSPPVAGAVRTTLEIAHSLSVNNCKRSNHSIRLASAITTPVRILPVHPYVLGAWLGDGTASGADLTIGKNSAIEMLELLANAGERYHASKLDPIRYGCYRLMAKLRRIGVLNNKHIPEEYLWASQEQRLELLCGLMDTDGCCNKDGQVEFWNMNEQLSRGVYHLAASLGVKPFWCEARATLYGKDCGPKFGVKWTAMLPCFKLKAKAERLPRKLRATQSWRYVIDVQPAGRREMRCLTTSNPSGLYLFGRNFNVTHNTQFLVADAAQEYRNPRLRGLLIRTTLEEMQELEELQQKMYEPLGAKWTRRRSIAAWRFPSGATIRPGYMAHDKHLKRYQGNPYTWLGIDESGQHPEERIRRLLPWLTTTFGTGLFPRARFTSNPGGDGHGWQMQVFLRNRCPVHFPADSADDRPLETSAYPGKIYTNAAWTDDSPVHKTTTFIPAGLADNPFYDENKRNSLLTLPKALQQQLLYGCWCMAEGLYFDCLRPDMVVPYATIGDAWWWQHFISVDYGFGNSFAAAGMYAINPSGRVFKTRERVEPKMPLHKFILSICKSGFRDTPNPKQRPQDNWLKKLKARDPERPRIAFCVMDEAMDQHRGQGESQYEAAAKIMAEHQIASCQASHDPEGNAQILYNGLANKGIVLTRDSAELPLTYRSLSTRVVDKRKAVKKVHGAWEDDCADETMYGFNTWRQNSEKPARTALAEEIAELRRQGHDETSLNRIAWNRELAIRKQEEKAAKGIRLSRNLSPGG